MEKTNLKQKEARVVWAAAAAAAEGFPFLPWVLCFVHCHYHQLIQRTENENEVKKP